MKKFGRYEVIEELGRGAMGVVYKASDPTIGRMVAIKVLTVDDKPEDGGPSSREIFLREARAAGRLSHPGIVTIHDALEDPATNSSYIVMEYIPGKTLEKILLSTPKLDPEKALDIIRQMAEALEYAHRNLIIHRDLKPANIILTEDGRAKITDFGIAKIAAQGAMRTVAIMGTPSYMSPEQVTGGEIDTRADLFSMGILFYLMLVGERPFAGDTAAVMFKIVYEDPIQPTKVNPLLPPSLDYVVLRCLAKDRAKRYSSAREFLDDLDDVRHGRQPRSQARVPLSELQTADRTMAATGPLLPIPPTTPAPAPPSPPAAPASAAPIAPVVTGPPPAIAAAAPTPAPATVPSTAKTAALHDAAPPTAPPPKSSRGVWVAVAIVVAAIAVGIWVSHRSGTPSTPVNPLTTPATVPAAASESASSPAPAEEEKSAKTSTALSSPSASGRSESRPTSPAPKPATPEEIESHEAQPPPAASAPAPATLAAVPTRLITLDCKYEFESATLVLLHGENRVYETKLVGKKKRGFIGIGGKGFAGELSEAVTIPGDAKELTVRVYSADGSVNVLHRISGNPPSPDATVLEILPTRQQLNVKWKKPQAPGK